MWHEIFCESELTSFLRFVNHFHDSCIREIRYVSGAYCEGSYMYPRNNLRVLTVIIQLPRVDIEMEFSGLKSLRLFPIDPNYTCEILDANVYIKDGFVYWCDSSALDPNCSNNDWGTIICARKLRWRKI